MSTIPRRPAPSRVRKRKSPFKTDKASFEYGWRLVRRKGQNGHLPD